MITLPAFLAILSVAAATSEAGSVCIAPVPHATSGSKSQANATASTVPYEFSVSFSRGDPVSVSHQSPVLVESLSLDVRHLVEIRQAGAPKASFRFHFSEYSSNRLCLWFNPLYESWSLTEPGRTPSCRCPSHSATRP